MSVPRAIRTVFPPFVRTNIPTREQVDGVDVDADAVMTIRRSIGSQMMPSLSPFLMLDHFTVGYPCGFLDHPRRGQEMITLMLKGRLIHEDCVGPRVTVAVGDVHVVTAGRGIVESDTPTHLDREPSVGLQLWVDLPNELRMCEPSRRMLRGWMTPVAQRDKVKVRVIMGQSYDVKELKKNLTHTPVWLLDVTLRQGGKIAQQMPRGFNVFVYTLEGTARFGAEGREVTSHHNVVFEEDGNLIVAENECRERAHFLIVGGKILQQTTVHLGVWAVNTVEDGVQARSDHKMHINGFESAKGWRSEAARELYP